MFIIANSLALWAADVRLVVTSGVNAALSPCDCPLTPVGGIARRKAALDALRRAAGADSTIVPIEFSGFVAGGPLDAASVSPSKDLERSRIYLDALRVMGYDRLIAGETETQWKAADLKALASADNDLGRWLKGVLDDHDNQATRLVYRNGDIYVFKAMLHMDIAKDIESRIDEPSSTDARRSIILLMDASPSEIAKNVRMPDDVDWLIVASSGASLTAQTLHTSRGDIVQTGAEARELLVITINKGFKIESIPLQKTSAEDEGLRAKVDDYQRTLKKQMATGIVAPIEYFGSLDCGYCKDSFQALQTIQNQFGGRVDIRLHLLVHKTTDGYSAGLGSGDKRQQDWLLEETKRFLLIKQYAPDKAMEYLARRFESPTGDLSGMDIPWRKINDALANGEANSLLDDEARLCQTMAIRATPSVFIFNRPFNKSLTAPSLATAICGLLNASGVSAPECADVPACNANSDCSKPGYWGECIEPGTPAARCDYTLAVPVAMRALYSSRAIHSNHEQQIQLLFDVLPGLSVSLIDIARSPDALARYPVNRLPAYVFDPSLAKTRNYADLADLFDWKTLSGTRVETALPGDRNALAYSRPDAFGSQYYIGRPLMANRLDIFASPLSNESDQRLIVALDSIQAVPASRRPTVVLHWVSHRLTNGQLSSRLGLGDLEESARRLAIAILAPEKLVEYIRLNGKTLGTSYWRESLISAGLDPDAVRAMAQSDAVLQTMVSDADECRQLAPGADFFILVENREVVESLNAALIEHIVGVVSKGEKE